MKKIKCHACGEIVMPNIKNKCVGTGIAYSTHVQVYVCPNKKCGEEFGYVEKYNDDIK